MRQWADIVRGDVHRYGKRPEQLWDLWQCMLRRSGLSRWPVWDWLNRVNAANYAGHSDWRLPSEAGCNSCYSDHACSCSPNELDTILLAPRDCYATPCIDPIFGPTEQFIYWSASISAPQPA